MITVPRAAQEVGRAVRTGECAVTTTVYEWGNTLYVSHAIPDRPESVPAPRLQHRRRGGRMIDRGVRETGTSLSTPRRPRTRWPGASR